MKTLPSESVHCTVTSPPYWGLRDYGVKGQIGLEKTPEEYVEKLVQVFREVKRVLRKDGTLWLNLGDSYNGSGGAGGDYNAGGLREGQPKYPGRKVSTLKPKDLVGIPWRVAFALQADGWWLRSDIIWAKPNAMPESVKDRPTKAHEYLFLLTKSQKYFYDADAIREPAEWSRWGAQTVQKEYRGIKSINQKKLEQYKTAGRNKRTVWWIATRPFSEAHFATFPPALVEPCIKAGTSEYGCCPKCGAPWERVVERTPIPQEVKQQFEESRKRTAFETGRRDGFTAYKPHFGREHKTIGWRPTCSCGIEETVPCVVLDPFGGSGTTAIVARQLGRNSVYIDLNPEYEQIARRRLLSAVDGDMHIETIGKRTNIIINQKEVDYISDMK